MNTVQIQLKSWDSRISGFQLDSKIVYEFQLKNPTHQDSEHSKELY
jgi:hypothetical protein